jgi:hypothetical protein
MSTALFDAQTRKPYGLSYCRSQLLDDIKGIDCGPILPHAVVLKSKEMRCEEGGGVAEALSLTSIITVSAALLPSTTVVMGQNAKIDNIG